ncbi:MAG: hypothetical protein OHK0015_21430 [Chloroflexi bacterium OHK40]
MDVGCRVWHTVLQGRAGASSRRWTLRLGGIPTEAGTQRTWAPSTPVETGFRGSVAPPAGRALERHGMRWGRTIRQTRAVLAV